MGHYKFSHKVLFFYPIFNFFEIGFQNSTEDEFRNSPTGHFLEFRISKKLLAVENRVRKLNYLHMLI